MKMHRSLAVALGAPLALALAAQAAPEITHLSGAKMLSPVRVAGARLVDGKVALITPWMGYVGAGTDATWVPAYDSYEGDDAGNPIGGEDCGDGTFQADSRWLYQESPTNAVITSDMTPDAEFGGGKSERTNFAWQWDHSGSCMVAVFTADVFGACGDFDMDQVFDGVVYDFGPQDPGAGYFSSDNDLTGNGLFHQLPAATGAFQMLLGEDDGFGGFQVTSEACQPMLWGTGDAGGPEDGAGSNGPFEFQDIGSPDGSIDPTDDCFDFSGAVPCPDPLATMMKFWVDDQGGPECYPDCVVDGTLDLFDFLCFVNDFNSNGAYSDCVPDGGHDLFDFLCFVNAFNAGC